LDNRSIKNNIIFEFIISGIASAIGTVGLVLFLFGFLHYLFNNVYEDIIKSYNNNIMVMLIFIIAAIVIFIILMYIIFTKRMKNITKYIEEISLNLNKISYGELNLEIPVRTKDELGQLAGDINKMAYNLNELISKEREWEKSKNNLITNCSHDLRTPLTTILGFLELIQLELTDIEEKNKEKKDKLIHYCTISLSKSNELKKSLDQLFEFTKLTDSEIKLNKTKINIRELVEQATIGFIPLFDKNSMEYRIFYTENTIIISVDVLLLVRAFENIIGNSIKYASKGKFLDVTIQEKDSSVLINFTTYGNKIESEDLKNIFNRFYRVEKKCDKNEGTGLGLAIVKTIVDLHNGNIFVRSTEEKTEFEIELSKIDEFEV